LLPVPASRGSIADAARRCRPWRVVKATRADLASDLVLTAEFEPFQEIDVMGKVSGITYARLMSISADRVKEGQVAGYARDSGNADDVCQSGGGKSMRPTPNSLPLTTNCSGLSRPMK